jgi:hypothetical protein
VLRKRLGFVLLIALGLGFLVGAPASAESRCVAWEQVVNSQGTGFTVVCAMYAPEGGGDPDNPDGPGPGPGGPRVCMWNYMGGHPVDCQNSFGTWNDDRQCWVAVMDSPPAQGDPVWEGNTDGYILECTSPDRTGATPPVVRFWAASSPDAFLPSPRELADRAVAQMELFTGAIGSTPPSVDGKPGSMGLIGVPMWFWVDEQGPGTTEPVEVSETAGPLTVTARADLAQVTWTLSDRVTGAVQSSVTCSGANAPGTKWTGAVGGDGKRPSPTCGLSAARNAEPGRYTLTAQATWSVSWEGGGEEGTVPALTPPSQSVSIDIAELQSIVVD